MMFNENLRDIKVKLGDIIDLLQDESDLWGHMAKMYSEKNTLGASLDSYAYQLVSNKMFMLGVLLESKFSENNGE